MRVSHVTGRVVDSYTNIHSVKLFAHHDRELDYAKEAIENTRRPSRAKCASVHHHGRGADVLNGLLIVAVVGWAIWLWMRGLRRVSAWWPRRRR
jgi:ATP-binding cassette subfamily B multidrug efflux pump